MPYTPDVRTLVWDEPAEVQTGAIRFGPDGVPGLFIARAECIEVRRAIMKALEVVGHGRGEPEFILLKDVAVRITRDVLGEP